MTSQLLSPQAVTPLDVFARLLRGYASATRALSAQLQAAFGLTINDYEALLRLAQAEDGRLRRVDLAEQLVLTPSGVTRLLDGLERSGYVKKAICTSDARVTYAVLTRSGRRRFKQVSRAHASAISALFADRFDAEELATLARLLERLPGAVAAGEECLP